MKDIACLIENLKKSSHSAVWFVTECNDDLYKTVKEQLQVIHASRCRNRENQEPNECFPIPIGVRPGPQPTDHPLDVARAYCVHCK